MRKRENKRLRGGAGSHREVSTYLGRPIHRKTRKRLGPICRGRKSFLSRSPGQRMCPKCRDIVNRRRNQIVPTRLPGGAHSEFEDDDLEENT
jgi:hypothetical protein